MSQIEFKNITKQYEPENKILENISFSVDPGEFAFLVGRSGAGKSTIVKLLIREIYPTEGEILFNDENISEIAEEELPDYRRKIGIVFQDFKLLESKTVFENVAIALEVVGAPDEEIHNVVPNTLNLVGLSGKENSYPRQLSGGEKQRVSIARALAHEPDVLIADEATGMIDPDSANEILEILEKINDLGTTVLMVTHDERIVDQLEKRVIRIEAGTVISDEKKGKYKNE